MPEEQVQAFSQPASPQAQSSAARAGAANVALPRKAASTRFFMGTESRSLPGWVLVTLAPHQGFGFPRDFGEGTQMRNMIGRPLGRVMVVTIGTKNPSDAEWGEMLDLGRRLHEEAGHDPARSGGVVFTDGGAPNSAQRQKVRTLYGDQPPA